MAQLNDRSDLTGCSLELGEWLAEVRPMLQCQAEALLSRRTVSFYPNSDY
jgi:hypothetical protein